MNKSGSKSAVIMAFSGALLSLAALLIFIFVPTSQLANGIEYAGTDALWVLAVSPIASLLGAVLFVLSFVKNFDEWFSTMSKPLVLSMTILLSMMSLFNFGLYLSYFISQVDLGFVAPYTGLIYDKLLTVAIVVTFHQFFFSAISLIAEIRKSKQLARAAKI